MSAATDAKPLDIIAELEQRINAWFTELESADTGTVPSLDAVTSTCARLDAAVCEIEMDIEAREGDSLAVVQAETEQLKQALERKERLVKRHQELLRGWHAKLKSLQDATPSVALPPR
eukprot:m.215938 g.215938  ORF g.215938 m.215938 type:complete len:118 (+) comp28107_c0_seq1:217-570(+)